MSQSTTAYLTEKCEVRNRDVAGGKAVFARELIEPGEVVAVWSGRLVSAEELDDLPEDIRRHTAQVEEGFYLASLNPDEAPDYINHSCEPNAGLDGQITIVAMRYDQAWRRGHHRLCHVRRLALRRVRLRLRLVALPRPRDRQRLARSLVMEALCRPFLALSAAPHRRPASRAIAAPADAQAVRSRARARR